MPGSQSQSMKIKDNLRQPSSQSEIRWLFFRYFTKKGVVETVEKATMSVQELASQMSISLPKAYKLVKTPGFPVIHVGSRILIPVEAYKDWLIKASSQQ